MKDHDLLRCLRRYTDPTSTAGRPAGSAQIVTSVWAHRLPEGWVTGASDGRVLVCVYRNLTGARLLEAQPVVLASVSEYATPPRPTHWAQLAELRRWAGSPDWPAVHPADCPRCKGSGELDCDGWELDIRRNHRAVTLCVDCPYAESEDCCEGRRTCDCLLPWLDPRPGLLLGVPVDRQALARLLDLPWMPQPGLSCAGPEQPLYLSDGYLRAALMPMRLDEGHESVPAFEARPGKGARR